MDIFEKNFPDTDKSKIDADLDHVIEVLTPAEREWTNELHPMYDLKDNLQLSVEEFQQLLIDICHGIDRRDLAKTAAAASEFDVKCYMDYLKVQLENFEV